MQKTKAILKQYFGYDDFRPGQTEIVDSIVQGKDVLAILPTGGGKSICFQVPALVLGGTTLVISPLISLMKDQIVNLVKRNISATFINSSLPAEEQEKRLQEMREGKYRFVYISPEKLKSKKFRELCMQIDIKFIAIDEAHCLSMWGHDFRPAYMEIGDFIYAVFQNKTRPVIAAYTATATELVKKDILSESGLKDPLVVQKSFARPNLHIAIHHCLDNHDKTLHTLRLIKKHQGQCGIIYVLTRARAVELTAQLNRLIKIWQLPPVVYYHGGMEAEERSRIQDDFIAGKLPLIIATNAFGMGVDKSDVRFVIHDQMSSNLENYYQEIGRGGRDGEVANCYLLFEKDDLLINHRFIEQGEHTFPEQKEVLHSKLQAVANYVGSSNCRQQHILLYFDEPSLEKCGHCDFCLQTKLTITSEEKGYYQHLLEQRNVLAKKKQQIPSSICTKLSLAYVAVLGEDALNNPDLIPGFGDGFLANHYPLLL